MKILLEEPFKSVWKFGYLVTNTENRKMICLFNSSSNRTTISYARYLLSVKFERFLEKDEHVDHIDGDKTNDTLSNLQILSPKENHNKSLKTGQVKFSFRCPVCYSDFQLTKQRAYKKINPCCSRKCSYKKLKLNKSKQDTPNGEALNS